MRLLASLALSVACAKAQVTFAGTIRGAADGGQTLYAFSGGYFKSTDAGANWNPLYLSEPGLPQPPLAGFAIDPRNESALYVATTPAMGPIWKSTDAGATWTRIGGGLPTAGTVTNTYFTIASTGALYLRLDTALYKSTDGAATWTRIATPLPGNAGPFDINFTNPAQMLYASGSGVRKSVDEGATWQSTATLRTFQDASTGASCIASDPMFPNFVYVCVAGSLIRVGNQIVTGLHRSTDGGFNFTPPPDLPAPTLQLRGIFADASLLLLQSLGGYCKSADRGANIRCIPDSAFGSGIAPTSVRINHLDRRNSNTAYATADRLSPAGTVMFRSRDAAETWQAIDARARLTLARPAAISVLLAPGGTAPVAIPVAALEMAAARLGFTASTSGEPWLSLSAASGTTPATLTATFQAGALEPGSRHEASIRLTSPDSANGSVTVPVVLQVARPSTTPAPAFDMSVIAGNGSATFSGDGGPATAAGIGDTGAIAVDRSGNIFFIATTHVRIRRVTPGGRIDTVAGTGTSASAQNGLGALQATLNGPRGLAVNAGGTIFFAESDGLIRQIANNTLGTAVTRGSGILAPSLLAMDPQNRLWIADAGRFFRFVPPSTVERLTPNPATTITGPAGFAIDAGANLYASDLVVGRVHRITPTGQIALYAGNGSAVAIDSVPAASTGLDGAGALAADRRGNLFIYESRRNRIRVVTPVGTIHTAASLEGRTVRGMAADDDGNVYVSTNGAILKLTPAVVTGPTLSSRPRNLASLSDDGLAPGSLFSIDGERLAAREEAAGDPPWMETLAGASAAVNGRPVPLARAGPNRLVGQLPYDLDPGPAGIVATANGTASGEIPFNVVPAAPGIFTMAEDATRAEGAVVENGEASVLVTGFGPVNPAVAAGTAPGTDPVSRGVLEFQVAVGELEGEPIEIALVPGLPGVGRARFKLPLDLAPGDYAVTIRIGEASSNSALVTVP